MLCVLLIYLCIKWNCSTPVDNTPHELEKMWRSEKVPIKVSLLLYVIRFELMGLRIVQAFNCVACT